MKKIITILLFISSLASFAQKPIIEGTYLPVRGTSVKEVWDTTYGELPIPPGGPSYQTWDYSLSFVHPSDSFQIKTFHPDSTSARFHQYYPTATHASFLKTPLKNSPGDSLYSYFIIDAAGLHNLGGFNISSTYDSTGIINPSELLVPAIDSFGMVIHDTSKYVLYAKHYQGFSGKIRGTKFKTMSGIGYGDLKMPNGIFHNVLLAVSDISTIDSIFVDMFNNGNYSFYTVQNSHYFEYSFLRNNTFGSSILMFLTSDATNTYIQYGWYTLPVDFGSISGLVLDSLNGGQTQHGEALLYRENSNFAKNDILDRSTLDNNGHYQFDSIPYGEYRIAIRSDSSIYHNAYTTYYGDSTNWISAPTIHTNSALTSVSTIHLQYHPVPSGTGIVHGNIGYNAHIRTNDPIPGVDIIVQKNPGGTVMEVKTDSSSGNYTLNALTNGSYTMFVDIPGCYMANGCNFSISNGTVINGFDCICGTDTIHPAYSPTTNINELYRNDNLMSVYPNPYSSSTTIEVNVPEKSDVLLELYNLLGEKIQTIEKAEKATGVYSYNLNSKNIKYATGTYILKLKVGDKTSVQKIIRQ